MSNYVKAFDLLNESDIWDGTAYDALVGYMGEDDSFNGNIKDFNKALRRGLWLAIEDPEKFKIWDDGFSEALGYSVSRIVEVYLDKVEAEDDA
tara:strand:+ start:663 stop:941 length:279 start_codon:yes stop_codon:yes gene_type:complete